MDEKEYRSVYQDINQIRCVFEKAINSRVCNCSLASRFNLADREGVSCHSNLAQQRCTKILQALRNNACFVLQQKSIDGQLAHNSEIKIQNGGVKGIAKLLNDTNADDQDIARLFELATRKYKTVEAFPFSEIMQEISAYQGRRKRKK